MICSHSTPWYDDVTRDELGNRLRFVAEPEQPAICPACWQSEVENEGDVCQPCRDDIDSGADVWCSEAARQNAVRLIAQADQRKGRAA